MYPQHRNGRFTACLLLVGIWLVFTLILFGFDLLPQAKASALLQTLPPRFINEQNTPLMNVPLRVLCYIEESGVYTQTHDLRDTTTPQGQLTHQLPIDCPHLVALKEIHQQPSGKPGRSTAYTVYNTSWSSGSATPIAASGDVVVRSDQHLVLFDVVVALEWEPSADSSYLRELGEGLRLASNYLYDITDGQMAFGTWQITTGGKGWESADIRIRAANDYRPSAQVGGIVAAETVYTTTNNSSLLYTPGAIVLGRYWNGTNAADPVNGAWNQPAAYRTLVHEWLHYALFLYDEYQSVDADGRSEAYCTCAELPQVGQDPNVCGKIGVDLAASVMGYHYTASELWWESTEVTCHQSEQFHVHGTSDWDTLERWGTIQGLPSHWLRKPNQLIAGPVLGNLAALNNRSPVVANDQRLYLPWVINQGSLVAMTNKPAMPIGSASLEASSTITLHLSISASLTLTDLLALQVQIYTWEPATELRPARVLHQGTTSGQRQEPNRLGQATLVGINPGAQVAVFITHPGAAEAASYVYYGPLEPIAGQQYIQAAINPNTLNLEVTPQLTGRQIQLFALTLQSKEALTPAPVAQICSADATVSCSQNNSWQQHMVSSGAGITWTATLTTSAAHPFPDLGILWIDTDQGPIFRWYETLGGVGPGRIRTHAPQRDGLITVDGLANFPNGENLVFIMSAANQTAAQTALPPGVAGAIGSPFTVKVLFPSTAVAAGQPVNKDNSQTGATDLPAPVIISMFYTDESLKQLNLRPNQIQLFQYQPTNGRWNMIGISGRSTLLNWVASRPLTSTEVLVSGHMISPDFGLKAEMFAAAGKLPNPSPIRIQIVMPGGASLHTQAAANVQGDVPLFITQVGQIQCNIGTCSYNTDDRQVVWQGDLDKDELLMLDYELYLNPTIPPGHLPKTATLKATAFDGVTHHSLEATVRLRGENGDQILPTPNNKEVLPPIPAANATQ